MAMAGTIPRPFNISSQGAPAVGADIIDALVWGQNAYGGTTQVITIAQSVNGAGLLWNPAGSGVSILMYGLQISANATSGTSFTPVTTTFGTTTAGLSGFSVSGTGSANKQTLTLPAVAKTPTGLIYQNVSLGAYAYNPIKTQFVTNNNGFIQFFGGFANTVLRPNSGIVVVLAAPTGGLTAAVSFDWVEYAVT